MSTAGEDELARRRDRMVRRTIEGRDVRDPAVIEAVRSVPRHRFLPFELADLAYADQPVPIGLDQTISQPYIVAKMMEVAGIGVGDRVLDVGTGSGYQAALLAALGCEVYSVEILSDLVALARENLASAGISGVHQRHGDGYRGWPEHAPYAAILVAAAPDHVPEPLVQQLDVGGRLVIPVGTGIGQELLCVERTADGVRTESICPVLFVPMTGR